MIEKKKKLIEVMNKHKTETELIKVKMESKDKLLKYIEESIPKLNKDDINSFKDIISIEKV